MRYLVLILALFALSCENSRSVRPDDVNDEIGDSAIDDADSLMPGDLGDDSLMDDGDDLSADSIADDGDLLIEESEMPDDSPCQEGESLCLSGQVIQRCNAGAWSSFDCSDECAKLGYTQSVGCGYSSNAGKDCCFCE